MDCVERRALLYALEYAETMSAGELAIFIEKGPAFRGLDVAHLACYRLGMNVGQQVGRIETERHYDHRNRAERRRAARARR